MNRLERLLADIAIAFIIAMSLACAILMGCGK